MTSIKLLVLSVPLITWGFLYLVVRFGGVNLRTQSPWVKFLSVVALIAYGLLFITNNPYADAANMFLLALWTAAWWLERRSKVQA
jgi:hypothetical protein